MGVLLSAKEVRVEFGSLVAAAGGIVAYDMIAKRSMTMGWLYDKDVFLVEWTATIIASLAVAAVAVSGAVECRCLIARGTAPPGKEHREWVTDGSMCRVR